MRIRQETGEVAPGAWLGGASLTATLGFGAFGLYVWNTALWAFILSVVFGAIATFCFYASGRQYFINVGERRAVAREAPQPSVLQSSPLLPPPPVVDFIASEANVPLIRTRQQYYSRLPARGDLVSGALAAFRHRGGRDAAMVAHLHVGEVNAHSVPWVGSFGAKRTLSESQTAELILALYTDYGYYYIPDTTSGLTYKSVPYGTYVAELDLDVIGCQTKRYIVDLVLTKSRENMRISLRDA